MSRNGNGNNRTTRNGTGKPEGSGTSTKRPKLSESSTRLVDLGGFNPSSSGDPKWPKTVAGPPYNAYKLNRPMVYRSTMWPPDSDTKWWEQPSTDPNGAPPRPPRKEFRRGPPRIVPNAEFKAERDFWTWTFNRSDLREIFRAWQYAAMRQVYVRRRTKEEAAKRAGGATKSNASGGNVPDAPPPAVPRRHTSRNHNQNESQIVGPSTANYPTAPGTAYFRIDGMIAVVPDRRESPENELSFSLSDLNAVGHSKQPYHTKSRNYPL